MRSLIRPRGCTVPVFTVLTGLLYPLAITGIAQPPSPRPPRAASCPGMESRWVRASLQNFSDPKDFWGRPSAHFAAALRRYGVGRLQPRAAQSRSDRWHKGRIQALRAADPGNSTPIPVDLITASASGLDPEESLAAALFQVPRITRTRGLGAEQVRSLIGNHSRGRVLGFWGNRASMCLNINLALMPCSESARSAALNPW